MNGMIGRIRNVGGGGLVLEHLNLIELLIILVYLNKVGKTMTMWNFWEIA